MGPDFAQAPREIIGIVADARDAGLNSDPQPATFVPLSQVRDSYMKLNNRFMPLSWVVRTHVEPYSLLPAIQRAFQQTADLPVAHVRTMDRIVIQSTARDEFNTLVSGHFRRRGDSAGVHRTIWADGLLGGAAHARVRHPPGAGRELSASCATWWCGRR